MKSKDIKVANYIAWGRGSNWYLKTCRDCGRTIFMCCRNDGSWRPFNSWQEGDVAPGEMILHTCN